MLKQITKTFGMLRNFSTSSMLGAIKFTMVDMNGNATEVEGEAGERLYDIAREYDVEFAGICQGNAVCGTCHCHVQSEFAEKFDEIEMQEESTLDMVDDYDEDLSRLACCTTLNEGMEGMEINFKA